MLHFAYYLFLLLYTLAVSKQVDKLIKNLPTGFII